MNLVNKKRIPKVADLWRRAGPAFHRLVLGLFVVLERFKWGHLS